MNFSNFFTINWRDLGKGVVTAIITAVLMSIGQIVEAGGFPTWEQLIVALKVGGVAGLGYLIKNLLSNDNGEFLAPNRNQ